MAVISVVWMCSTFDCGSIKGGKMGKLSTSVALYLHLFFLCSFEYCCGLVFGQLKGCLFLWDLLLMRMAKM